MSCCAGALQGFRVDGAVMAGALAKRKCSWQQLVARKEHVQGLRRSQEQCAVLGDEVGESVCLT